MNTEVTITNQIHIRYEGSSFDITFDELSQESGLDVGFLSSDNEIRAALAQHLNAPLTKLNRFNLSRNEQTSTITLRPSADFGG